MSENEMASMIATLEAQVQALTAKLAASKSAGKLTLKVSAKGAVSVYGLNARFPVTLYADQWTRLLDQADTIRAFSKDNAGALSTK